MLLQSPTLSTKDQEKTPLKFRRKLLSLWLFISALLLVCCIVISAFSQGKIDSIKIVADDNYPPYIFRSEKGELQGIIVDEWKLWEARTGIRVHLEGYHWDKAYHLMLAGKADVLETVFFNQERAKIFDFTNPYAKLEVPVYYHNSLSGIKDIQTLRGFTIGVKAGDACISVFRQNGITTLKEYNNYEAIIKAAANGEVRVFCIDRPPAVYYLYKYNLSGEFNYAFTLYTGEFHRAVKKGNTAVFDVVTNGFAKISSNEIDEIEKRWMGVPFIQPQLIRYAIYTLFIVGILILGLVIINILLRRKVEVKTRQLEIAFGELSRSEEKYREIFETANEGICIANATDTITSVNKKFEEMVGFSSAELIGTNFRNLVLPEELADYGKVFEERKSGKRSVFERNLVKKDGGHICALISTTSLFDGKVFLGTIEMLTDITERKISEENLRKFFLGVEQSPGSILIIDINEHIDYANQKFVQTSGYSLSELINSSKREKSEESDYAVRNRELWQLMLQGREWSGEIRSFRKNGEPYWESALISPVRNAKGEQTHAIVIKEDISEKKKMIENLIEAKDRAEEMNRLKSSFLANMSHELRTPLVGILGFSEILSSTLKDQEHMQLAQSIYKGGRRLSDTLNMILDLSKMESNKEIFNPYPLDIGALTREVAHSYSSAASNKFLSLETVIKADKIVAVLDDRLIRNILHNLINNAIKYTEKGSVTIEVGTEIHKKKTWAYIKVQDTGIGIHEKNIDLIFEEFRQESEGFGRRFEGTGLGLTIAKKATKMMNGVISVESTVGVGSTFKVRFPVFEQRQDTDPAAGAQA
jgi:PAS domain S-box-containing protein